MKTVDKLCEYCNQHITVELRQVKRGKGRFCNRSCATKFQHKNSPRPKHNCTCDMCGITFYRNASKQKNSKSGYRFCSKDCKNQAQRLTGIKEMWPEHYDSGRTNYREIALREFPNQCNRCGYDNYIEVLQVHHKDRDRKNNTLDNLEILCPTCHKEEHVLNK